ncbi:mitochondrial intermediate peptidase, mitochondrial-like isoform X1 [Magnolia sinica]|uniref:mitochondrial intermediate peptidase, mitochondrial-like isoform X1 n=1 Tax=Magnolia sinica TaxID=86752 RepID=UPI00265AF0B7|nr:mitochondrial intermediate peptidase, mitochondrial-like isoform X1 [Magnolia sinica]
MTGQFWRPHNRAMFFKGFILLHFNSVHNFVIACTMCSSLLPSILSACLCDLCIDLELISHSFGFSFSENIITDPGFVDIFPASQIPKHMQHLLKPIYRTMTGASKEPLGSRDTVKEKGFRVTTDPGTLSSILKWASDAEFLEYFGISLQVRKQSYISGNSVPRANLGVLDKLIAARHELAEIMGYKSYAQFAVHPNIASSRDVVMPFLLDLSKIIMHKADEEFKAIRDFKRKICNEDCADLEPWDEAYFTGMMKSSTFNLDSSAS